MLDQIRAEIVLFYNLFVLLFICFSHIYTCHISMNVVVKLILKSNIVNSEDLSTQ